MSEIQQTNVEEIFEDVFSSASGTGEEELLRIAAKYSVQLSGQQLRTLMVLRTIIDQKPEHPISKALQNLASQWMEYKQYHNSMGYVMRALGEVSLRRFVNENSVKVNVQKQ